MRNTTHQGQIELRGAHTLPTNWSWYSTLYKIQLYQYTIWLFGVHCIRVSYYLYHLYSCNSCLTAVAQILHATATIPLSSRCALDAHLALCGPVLYCFRQSDG